MANHRINKLKLEVEFKNETQQNARHKVQHIYQASVLQVLESVLDEFQIAHDITIEKLDIDLGSIQEADFEERFKAMLRAQLNTHLPKQPLKPQKKTTQPTPSFDTMFLFFLENGYWPWPVQTFLEEERQSWWNEKIDTEEQLMYWLKICSQKPEQYALRFIQLMAVQKNTWGKLTHALAQIHTVLQLEVDDFFQAVRHQNRYEPFIQRALALLMNAPPLSHKKEWNQWVGQFFLPHTNRVENKRTKASATVQNIFSFQFFIEKINPSFSKSTDENKKIEWATEQELSDNIKLTEAIQIANAGIILLHPFLALVFKSLGYINAQHTFIDRQKQQRAIRWLQYFCEAQSIDKEHLLPLNKILCGYPLLASVPVVKRWKKIEKEAAIEVAQSLIEHWNALGKTSVVTLLHSFIRRNGLIKKQDDNFILQVESKGIDVLIERLPFSLSIVKLPWNEYFIHTEWTPG